MSKFNTKTLDNTEETCQPKLSESRCRGRCRCRGQTPAICLRFWWPPGLDADNCPCFFRNLNELTCFESVDLSEQISWSLAVQPDNRRCCFRSPKNCMFWVCGFPWTDLSLSNLAYTCLELYRMKLGCILLLWANKSAPSAIRRGTFSVLGEFAPQEYFLSNSRLFSKNEWAHESRAVSPGGEREQQTV